MKHYQDDLTEAVNCRIGSLEKADDTALQASAVNCRIGSLEKDELEQAHCEPS